MSKKPAPSLSPEFLRLLRLLALLTLTSVVAHKDPDLLREVLVEVVRTAVL